MEDDAIVAVLQMAYHRLHARRRDAEHGQPDGRLDVGHAAAGSGARLTVVRTPRHHAGQRMGSIGQDPRRDPVDAGDVGDRVHHADVRRPDIGLDVPRSDGGHHDLGHPDGKFAHRCRRHGGAAGAARGDDAADVAPLRQELREGDRHLAHGAAPVAGEDGTLALRMVAGHLARMDHRRRRLARRGEIDRHRPQAELLQAAPQEEELAGLGVERAGHIGGALHVGCDREFDHACIASESRQRLRRLVRGRQLGAPVRTAFQQAVHRPVARLFQQPVDRRRRTRATAVPARQVANRPCLVVRGQARGPVVEAALDGEDLRLHRLTTAVR
jgi:hypothetical protein